MQNEASGSGHHESFIRPRATQDLGLWAEDIDAGWTTRMRVLQGPDAMTDSLVVLNSVRGAWGTAVERGGGVGRDN